MVNSIQVIGRSELRLSPCPSVAKFASATKPSLPLSTKVHEEPIIFTNLVKKKMSYPKVLLGSPCPLTHEIGIFFKKFAAAV
jgi:hypothetical protein